MIKHFNYHLAGAGWAEVWFVSDKQKTRFEVSYLSDPLRELCTGLMALITDNAKEIEVIFADEPGEHRLLLRKSNDEILETEILCSEECKQLDVGKEVKACGTTIYRETDTIHNFATIICVGIQDLLDRQSLDEYIQKWVTHDFPSNVYEKLKTACGFKN